MPKKQIEKRIEALERFTVAQQRSFDSAVGGNGAVGDWRLRSQHTEEYMAILRLRPAGAQILD